MALRQLITPNLTSFPILPFSLSHSKTRPPSSLLTRTFSISSMTTSQKKVLVPIANGTEPMEAVIQIDILRRSGAQVTVASVEEEERNKLCVVDALWGLKLVADSFISDCVNTKFDLISLPGGMPGSTSLRDCVVLENMVRKQAEEGRLYAAICAAPAVALGAWGLLKGFKATCFPSFMELLASEAVAVESRVQEDGQTVTSRGAGTAIEYALVLVEKLYGKEKADEVTGPLVMRLKHGDDYTVTEFNPVKWTFNDTPQRKVKLVADMFLEEAAKLPDDLIVLPGGLPGAQTFSNSENLGKKATAFPALCDKLSDRSEADKRVVVDANLITSRGPGTSIEFSLAIVEKFFGHDKAYELAKAMVFISP
ncbi:hypothetical protein IFM89_031949 [Coptis chinensis]|uniref:DJ-1/PfpI domain-containing protein n=1 Tax=Coptis chinensis TaxID=261450 RepID=A0A835H3W5_9MAGN|nr:hypothetical protein IFM89_031949 [Coptis chinensis]